MAAIPVQLCIECAKKAADGFQVVLLCHDTYQGNCARCNTFTFRSTYELRPLKEEGSDG